MIAPNGAKNTLKVSSLIREDKPPTKTVVLCGSEDAFATAALAICDAVEDGTVDGWELRFASLLK